MYNSVLGIESFKDVLFNYSRTAILRDYSFGDLVFLYPSLVRLWSEYGRPTVLVTDYRLVGHFDSGFSVWGGYRLQNEKKELYNDKKGAWEQLHNVMGGARSPTVTDTRTFIENWMYKSVCVNLNSRCPCVVHEQRTKEKELLKSRPEVFAYNLLGDLRVDYELARKYLPHDFGVRKDGTCPEVPNGANSKLVGVQVGLFSTDKEYPHVIRLIEGLLERGHGVVVFGYDPSKNTKDYLSALSEIEDSMFYLCPKSGWNTIVQVLVNHVDLVIAADTGLLHFSQLFGMKAIGLFGPTYGSLIGKHFPTLRYLQGECPYSKKIDGTMDICLRGRKSQENFGCRGNLSPCMTSITPELVLREVDNILYGNEDEVIEEKKDG